MNPRTGGDISAKGIELMIGGEKASIRISHSAICPYPARALELRRGTWGGDVRDVDHRKRQVRSMVQSLQASCDALNEIDYAFPCLSMLGVKLVIDCVAIFISSIRLAFGDDVPTGESGKIINALQGSWPISTSSPD